MEVTPPPPGIGAMIAGWLIALGLALGIAYLMFSTVNSVVERHAPISPTAALPPTDPSPGAVVPPGPGGGQPYSESGGGGGVARPAARGGESYSAPPAYRRQVSKDVRCAAALLRHSVICRSAASPRTRVRGEA